MPQKATSPGAGTCVCGHTHNAHEHYRKGTDCAVCAPGQCIKFTLGSPAVVEPDPRLGTRPPAEAPRR